MGYNSQLQFRSCVQQLQQLVYELECWFPPMLKNNSANLANSRKK
jgi:hypothetical protein